MKKSSAKLCYFCIGGLLLFMLGIVLTRTFHPDELEHIHASWYISRGRIPYKDFFEHHNPLLWYLSAPLLKLFGEKIGVLYIFRFVSYATWLLILVYQFKLANLVIGKKRLAFLCVLFPFIFVEYSSHTLEFRPDNQMMLFEILSLYYLIKFIQISEHRLLYRSTFFLSLSFLFLQKAIFFISGYGIVFLYLVFYKKIAFSQVAKSFVGFLLPVILYVAYLATSESLIDYWETNWILNMKMLKPFNKWETFTALRTASILTGIVAFTGILLKPTYTFQAKSIAIIGIVLVFSLFFVKYLHPHYLVPMYLFLPIGFAIILNNYATNTKIIEVLSMFFVCIGIYNLVKEYTFNVPQLKKINFVLKKTERNDLVFDGWSSTNIFREDPHYFWFSLDEGMAKDTG